VATVNRGERDQSPRVPRNARRLSDRSTCSPKVATETIEIAHHADPESGRRFIS
jgi:hypothetical protein